MASVTRPTVHTKFGEALQTPAKQTVGTLIIEIEIQHPATGVSQHNVMFLTRKISDPTKKYLLT